MDTDQRVFHVLSDRKGLQLVNAQIAMKTLGMTNLNGMKTSCGFAYKLNYAVCTWSRGLHNRQFATLQWLPKSMVHVRSIIEIDSVTVHNSWLVNAKDKNWKPSGYGNRVVTYAIWFQMASCYGKPRGLFNGRLPEEPSFKRVRLRRQKSKNKRARRRKK